MEWTKDGSVVTMSTVEYGQLQSRIEAAEASVKVSAKQAADRVLRAERLLEESVSKEALINMQRDLTNALNRRADDAAQIVREAEHFMREVYHRMQGVSRVERSELVQLMDRLRPKPY